MRNLLLGNSYFFFSSDFNFILHNVTFLAFAIVHGQKKVVEALLNTEKVDADFVIPKRKKTALYIAVERNQADIVTMLLKKGVNVDFRDKEGRTALALAFNMKYASIIHALLSGGASLIPDECKKIDTPLWILIEEEFCSKKK